jgi:predicted P-loop ATPase
MSAPLDVARGYIARGWSLVPAPYREKGPVLEGWQALRVAAETAPEFFNGRRQNIGVLLGNPSGGLTDADLDTVEARALAHAYLPPTGSVYGRAGSPASHRLYVAPGIGRVLFTDPEDRELLLELRGDGHQSLLPGSTHPGGEPYAWDRDGEPAAVDAASLKTAAGRLAAAAMLVRAAPQKGRHDFLLAVANALTRALGGEEAKRFLVPVAEAALSDREEKAGGELRRMVDRAAALLADGGTVTGWPKLLEELGEKRTAALAKWLGIRREREPGDEPAWRSRLLLNEKGVPKVVEANVATVLRLDPAFATSLRFNELAHAVECSALPWRACEGWRAWEDVDDIELAIWCQEHGLSVKPVAARNAAQAVAAKRRHHPVRSWLQAQIWDGTKRLDSWLKDYLGVTEGDPEYIREVGRRWLISAVARVFRPGAKADHALILEGPQGVGKSSSLAALVPDRSWFADEISDLGSKDSAQDLRAKWLIEISELSAMRRSDVERTKAFVARAVDHYRPSFGHRSLDFPRQCVFAATTNAAAYLGDETGGRRWWPVKVGAIKLAELEEARPQLWAEAVHAFKAGERWWLSGKAEAAAGREQEDRFVTDPWEEALFKWVAEQKADAFAVPQVLSGLGVTPDRQDQSSANRVARIFRAAGWERVQRRVHGNRTWLYERPGGPPPSPVGAPTGDTSPVGAPPAEPASPVELSPSPVPEGPIGDEKASKHAGITAVTSVTSNFYNVNIRDSGGRDRGTRDDSSAHETRCDTGDSGDTGGAPESDPRQLDIEDAIAAASVDPPSLPEPLPPAPRPAPKLVRRPRAARGEWPDREDLEGWRARLRDAMAARKSATDKRAIVGAWLALWGGRLDGYGNPHLPDGLPECAVATALRSACEHYWRVTGDSTDPKRPRANEAEAGS